MEPIQHLIFAEARAERRDLSEPVESSPRGVALLGRISELLRGRPAPVPAPLGDCA